MTEAKLQEAVAGYLRLQYPDVMFHSDFGSGIKLTPGQAVRQKRQNGYRKGWPDIFIAEPVTITSAYMDGLYAEYLDNSIEVVGLDHVYYTLCGLFIELKKEGTRLKKKNGDWATDHIAEQADVLEKLRARGYCAEFAVGFDEAKRIIDEYLGGGDAGS